MPGAFTGKILEDRERSIWIAVGYELMKFENGKLRFLTKDDGFEDSGMQDLTEDREGAIWVGTYEHGLARINRQFITSLTSEKSGLWSSNVYPLYEDADGTIWSGAWYKLSRKRQQNKHKKPKLFGSKFLVKRLLDFIYSRLNRRFCRTGRNADERFRLWVSKNP